MSTKIEWTEETWNPVVGCTHISPGCDHCYAARDASGRLAHTPMYAGLAAAGKFTGEVRLLPERLDQPLRWRKPRRVFVNSMSDLFHDAVPNEFIARVFAVMGLARQHTFQVLTKRHARMRSLLADEGFVEMVGALGWDYDPDGQIIYNHSIRWPWPNVWLGVSVETQQWADIRIPALLDTPDAVRFLSCEPLLGPVDLARLSPHRVGGPLHRDALRSVRDRDTDIELEPRVDWVIVGGESGPRARPMHPNWAREIRDECLAADVPFFFKQWGEWGPIRTPSGEHSERVGRRAAGRELDGRTWDEYPAVSP